jgi:hypothetical protein
VADGPEVQGNPHLFAGSWSEHNPGAVYHWTARPSDGGVPRLERYSEGWAEELLNRLWERPGRSTRACSAAHGLTSAAHFRDPPGGVSGRVRS